MTTSATTIHRLHCMEIVGGNRATRQQIQGFGLEIWIDSRPFDVGLGGGDIHYVSSCGGGEVIRMALADVSGHGAAVDRLAQTLRRLIRKHMNIFDQTKLARALNREFLALAEEGRFATALILTYFAPTGHLIVCNAGHCPPLWYRASEARWQIMESGTMSECESLRRSKARYHLKRISNLPLGILSPTEYAQFAVELHPGDRVVLYTDGIIEAEDADGAQLGTPGLLDLIQRCSADQAAPVGEQLLTALARRQGERPTGDDSTLMVLEKVEGETRPLSIGTTLKTLGKMLGLSRV